MPSPPGAINQFTSHKNVAVLHQEMELLGLGNNVIVLISHKNHSF